MGMENGMPFYANSWYAEKPYNIIQKLYVVWQLHAIIFVKMAFFFLNIGFKIEKDIFTNDGIVLHTTYSFEDSAWFFSIINI
jgi:hypothetical protein